MSQATGIKQAFRIYATDECGPDGYPLHWHKLPEPEFTDLLDAADLVLPGGIKDIVRALACHRCVRCLHPFRVRAGQGRWSPCDLSCLHGGPYRWRFLHSDGPGDWTAEAEAEAEIGRMLHASHIAIEAEYRILTVHHLNGVKADCRWWNLAALCQRCHLTIQGKVVMDRVWPHEHSDWFKPYVAGYYAWRYLGEEIGRDEAIGRMDELLALEVRQLTLGEFPGVRSERVNLIHVKDRIVPGGINGFGFRTLHPFHAEALEHYMRHGLAFLGMVTVVTDVVRENNQTYRLGWTEQCKDGSPMGVGVPEYVLLLRKPPTDLSNGYADEPIVKDKDGYSLARWQVDAHGFWRSNGNRHLLPEELAGLTHAEMFRLFRDHNLSEVYDYEDHVDLGEHLREKGKLPVDFMLLQPPSWHPDVWTDVARMRTLNMVQAQKGKEQHLCPLQFDIVERLIGRYSNPGDMVFDPFAGIMTVPYCAVKLGRVGVGVELSPLYWRDGVEHVRSYRGEALHAFPVRSGRGRDGVSGYSRFQPIPPASSATMSVFSDTPWRLASAARAACRSVGSRARTRAASGIAKLCCDATRAGCGIGLGLRSVLALVESTGGCEVVGACEAVEDGSRVLTALLVCHLAGVDVFVHSRDDSAGDITRQGSRGVA